MINIKKINKLKEISGLNILENVPLKNYTTWKIGGPADYLLKVTKETELIDVCIFCIKNDIEFAIIGKGSNLLISDDGYRGLIIINDYKNIEIKESFIAEKPLLVNDIQPRVEENEFNYEEKVDKMIKVTLSSGTILSLAINTLIEKGITGLQWFAGIPGTIGGALYNNIHGGNHFFSEFVESAKVINEKGEIKVLNRSEMDLGYDISIFHKKKYIILNVSLNLNLGDKNRALKTAIAWTKKKLESQVFNSAGCCFKNISNEDKAKYNLPSNSWGYIIDNILKLKGTKVGGAQISNKHAAFIENISGATAKDILELFNLIYIKSENQLHIKPKTEIFFLGFNRDLIQKYL